MAEVVPLTEVRRAHERVEAGEVQGKLVMRVTGHRYHFQGFRPSACLLAIGVAAHAASLLTNLTLVDVETGTLTEGQSVLIREGIVAGIGTDMTPTDGSDVIERADGYLVPGLWGQPLPYLLRRYRTGHGLAPAAFSTAAGIGDMGAPGRSKHSRNCRRGSRRARLWAQVWSCQGHGWMVVPDHGQGMFFADTPDKARAVVDRIASEGWAAVKSYSMPDEPTCLALADAAKAEGSGVGRTFPRAHRAWHGH
ncbi:MAG: hypothetical protein IPL38_15565 [Rhodobacter sp.]|nr:hypothetical protein [Rhodobacter sp.]